MKNIPLHRFTTSLDGFRKIPETIKNFRWHSSAKVVQSVDIDKIRNIGILAHIDAGKTTTTERMLYYSGLIQQMGEVHHGNTVTDYLAQERERGITITSAAITFYWKKNQFNLIDTPGHIDFTMEVEKTLNVLDGAIVVLDGSAGVEAQTLTVWRQADRNEIPRIIYVNKMDRVDSDILMCCDTIDKKLETTSLLLQLPVLENGKLSGIIDVLTMELLNYGSAKDKRVNKIPLTEKQHCKYWNDASLARSQLIEKLTDFDDELANQVISCESLDCISTPDLIKSLKSVTRNQVATPVLLGSSYKNIGVQSLMDAVILYLPSPHKRYEQFSAFEDNLCARAFKVIHDKQRGPLVFFRIYNGSLKKGQKLYSIKQDSSEQMGKLYIAYADDFEEVEEVTNGNIAVVSGLKKIVSGDLVTNSSSSSQKAKNNIVKKYKGSDVETLLGLNVTIPEPVFFCSIEPPSLSVQSALEQALFELQREDPSLRVNHDPETGQTVLAGMGELHLDIIRDKILRDYKIEVDLGPLQIAYREAPVKEVTDTLTVDTKIGNSKQFVNIKLSLVPSFGKEHGGDILKLDRSPEYASNISNIFPKHLVAIRQGK
nr:ribosome-releasing factor 2, mitochondrial [Leptinotarsa decemlineata]